MDVSITHTTNNEYIIVNYGGRNFEGLVVVAVELLGALFEESFGFLILEDLVGLTLLDGSVEFSFLATIQVKTRS